MLGGNALYCGKSLLTKKSRKSGLGTSIRGTCFSEGLGVPGRRRKVVRVREVGATIDNPSYVKQVNSICKGINPVSVRNRIRWYVESMLDVESDLGVWESSYKLCRCHRCSGQDVMMERGKTTFLLKGVNTRPSWGS